MDSRNRRSHQPQARPRSSNRTGHSHRTASSHLTNQNNAPPRNNNGIITHINRHLTNHPSVYVNRSPHGNHVAGRSTTTTITTTTNQNRHQGRISNSLTDPPSRLSNNSSVVTSSSGDTSTSNGLSIFYSYMIAICSSFLVVLGIYLALTRIDAHFLYISILGLFIEAFSACIFCISNFHTSKVARRKERINSNEFIIMGGQYGLDNQQVSTQMHPRSVVNPTHMLTNQDVANIVPPSETGDNTTNVSPNPPSGQVQPPDDNNSIIENNVPTSDRVQQGGTIESWHTTSTTILDGSIIPLNSKSKIISQGSNLSQLTSPIVGTQSELPKNDNNDDNTNINTIDNGNNNNITNNNNEDDIAGYQNKQIPGPSSLQNESLTTNTHDITPLNPEKTDVTNPSIDSSMIQQVAANNQNQNEDENQEQASDNQHLVNSSLINKDIKRCDRRIQEDCDDRNQNKVATSSTQAIKCSELSEQQSTSLSGEVATITNVITDSTHVLDNVNNLTVPGDNDGNNSEVNCDTRLADARSLSSPQRSSGLIVSDPQSPVSPNTNKRPINSRRTLVMGLSGQEELIEIDEEDLDEMSILPPSYDSIVGPSASLQTDPVPSTSQWHK